MTQFEVEEADITALPVDVIVNAANSSLAGGGGVDGAIHRAAGAAKLHAACAKLGGCETGDVKMTSAFALPAQAIFHTVGPIWHGGGLDEAVLLASCYRRCIALAEDQGYSSIAFPAISCGVYGYPLDQAVAIAISTVRHSLSEDSSLERVVFCCFDAAMADRYRSQIAQSQVK
jgi:O-acetyl-ADP-ribose deacetylase